MAEQFDPEKFMQLAVETMENSIQEPRADKISPKVGAVLVSPDGEVLDTAFRGELREGDHAEFTLLERKNRNKDVTGCYLFATLEPCAPGARKHPKRPCAERIVDARIAKVWVGIEDPDPTVDRWGIKHLQKSGIEVHMFSPDFQKMIRKSNEEFLKQATDRAQAAKTEAEPILNALDKIVPATDLSFFSAEALAYYVNRRQLPFDAGSDELHQHLAQLQLIKADDGGRYVPTGAGILLFGKDPRATYPDAVVKAKVKYGGSESVPIEFDGPLVLIPQAIEQWLRQSLHSKVNRENFERETSTDFPMQPLREAIINALVHRDYELEGAKTYVTIDDDKIEIKSAGLPVSPITLEQVQRFKASSLSRNPKITYIFNKMKLMEESELGMETFRSMLEKHGLPLPEFNYTEPYLSLIFPRSMAAVKTVTDHKGIAELSAEELRGYEWVKSLSSASRKEYADQFGFDDRKANRQLKHLFDLGLLNDNGEPAKSNKYRYIFEG